MLVTGQTENSRLSELRKYTISSDITKQYIEFEIEYRAYGTGSGQFRAYEGDLLRANLIKNGVDFSQLEYTDVEEEFRAYGEDDDELRVYSENEGDLRKTTGPVLSKIVYYIDGIKYTDYPLLGITTFEYYAIGTDSPHFIHAPIYKDPKKENIISRPKIQDGVFIVRQELSAFDKNYRLQFIDNLFDLTTYLGGNYFNIVNNT